MSTIGQGMTRAERKALDEAVVQSNYGGGALLAPLQFKANEDDEGMLKPVKFRGFGNTGKADLGDDIVDPAAFGKQTITEFLKFGKQLLFMHKPIYIFHQVSMDFGI